MKTNADGLNKEGRALEIPPRSAVERRAFGGWLAKAVAHCGLTPSMLAEETGVPVRDIDAMIWDQSHGTAKADRVLVYEFVADRVCTASGKPERSIGADPRPRLDDVFARRTEHAAFFSPGDDLRCAITTVIQSAATEIRIQAWQLTCPVIRDALMKTRARIDIAISQESRICAALRQLMESPRISVYCDPQRKNHNKTIVVDRSILLTGSVNFLYRSGAYDENLLVTSQHVLVEAYWNDFENKRVRLLRLSA